jgi:hypothetical protein
MWQELTLPRPSLDWLSGTCLIFYFHESMQGRLLGGNLGHFPLRLFIIPDISQVFLQTEEILLPSKPAGHLCIRR